MNQLNIIILAAGQGKRMHSRLPKVLHRLAGKPMLAYVLDTARTLSPQRIILGGGVMRQAGLLDRIRNKVPALLNGYLEAPGIVPPALGGEAGVLGAIALAAGLS